ncbi:VWA domain-containing protein [Mariniluteicoccus endophyticus]
MDDLHHHRSSPWRRLLAGVAALGLVAGLGACAGNAKSSYGGQSEPAVRQTGVAAPDARPMDHTSPGPSPQSTPAVSNPVTETAEDPQSTFALDVDTGSWTRTRGRVRGGNRPSPQEVRTEEFINAFPQDYQPPAEGIDVRMDGTAVPWLPQDSRVVRVGVQSAVVDQSKRPDANLTFVIDVSGSMAGEDKLSAAQEALRTLTRSLRPTDSVTIVVYGSNSKTVLKKTPVSKTSVILGAIDDLKIDGSTNAEEGLKRGYDEAMKNREDGKLNRVVLLSDGVANVGKTGPEAILQTIGKAAQKKVDLVTVGFGGDFNDHLMEQLADKGNGFFAYVDNADEASRLFRENLTGTLVTTGRDAKAQVNFDPAQVKSYRLLGYENRAVDDKDFRNDKVDGGEVGSGHSTTALYEVKLAPGADQAKPLGRATVRYLHPDTREATERTATLTPGALSASLEAAPLRLQQDVVVASLSESLRGGPWGEIRTRAQIAADAEALAVKVKDTPTADLADVSRRLV